MFFSPDRCAPIGFGELGDASQIDNVLKIFFRCLEDNNIHSSMKRPALGSIGFTFLCSMPMSEIKEKVFNFVLKWLPKKEVQNEIDCANFLRCNGFSTPLIQIASKEVAGLLTPHALKANNDFKYNHEKDRLVIMPKFLAETFHSAIKNSYIFDLTDEEKKGLFTSMGQIAIYDLLMGNDDRLFRLDFESQNFFGAPWMNSGNLMLQSHIDEKSKTRKLDRIHYIDNTTSILLMGRQTSVTMLDLFDEGSSERVYDADFDPTKQLTQFKSAFRFLIKNLDLFENHVHNCLIQRISSKNTSIDKLSKFKESIKGFLRSGMEQALITLKNLDLSVAQRIFSEKDPLSQRILELVEANLNFLKNQFEGIISNESSIPERCVGL